MNDVIEKLKDLAVWYAKRARAARKEAREMTGACAQIAFGRFIAFQSAFRMLRSEIWVIEAVERVVA